MFYYIRKRSKGIFNWKALREDSKIVVFDKYEAAKKYADSLTDSVSKIVKLLYHPAHKLSPIYWKKYRKIGR